MTLGGEGGTGCVAVTLEGEDKGGTAGVATRLRTGREGEGGTAGRAATERETEEVGEEGGGDDADLARGS